MHEGCNDVSNKKSTPEKNANEIGDLVILCRDYSVNGIFISAMICGRDTFLNEKVKRIFFLIET